MAINDYEAIDSLESKQNDILDNSIAKQQEIINKQTQMNVDQLQRQKDKLDDDVTKTNKALYTEYKKNNNPYGANAEKLASKGLGNSGYAETTQTNLYNTYQRNITDTLNNARNLKSDFDFQMAQARQQGDITLAQNILDIYNQKLQLLTQNYELRSNREQFLYQQGRDKVADDQWNKTFNYQQQRDKVSDNQWQQTFDYQHNRDMIADDQWNRNFEYQQNRDMVSDNQWEKQYAYQQNRDKVSDSQWNKTFKYQQDRDKVSDSQWQKEYELSKKAKASSSSSSRRSSGRKSSSSSTSGYVISKDDGVNNTTQTKYSPQEILSKVQTVQGPGIKNNIKDGISGETFGSMEELLAYYGYGATN